MKYVGQAFVIALSTGIIVVLIAATSWLVCLQTAKPTVEGKGPIGNGGPFICLASSSSSLFFNINYHRSCDFGEVMLDWFFLVGVGFMAFFILALFCPIVVFITTWKYWYIVLCPVLFYGFVAALSWWLYHRSVLNKSPFARATWGVIISPIVIAFLITLIAAIYFFSQVPIF